MINIQGIHVDVVGSIDSLLAERTIFTVEFEYDNKLLVCHTLDVTVKRTLTGILRKILGPKEMDVTLRQALLQSKYIVVDVVKTNSYSTRSILESKYEMIENCMSYHPYGYNSLLCGLTSGERHYASMLARKLIKRIDDNAKIKFEDAEPKKTKEVHAYDKATGLYIKSFTSAKEASEATGVCQSNISMCCKGHINTAGKYIWSCDKKQFIEPPEDKRRRRAKATPTPDELARRQREFIQKNLKA